MPFVPGDFVHVASLGKGTVREVRNSDRYLVEIKGRSLVAGADQLTPVEAPRKARRKPVKQAPEDYEREGGVVSIDLHARTVAEALEAVSEFLNGAMLAGNDEVRIIHGRSGGKIKSAVHAQLARIPSVRSFRVDPRNAGVTIVRL